MTDTVMELLDLTFDLAAAAIGLFCLLKCVSVMNQLLDIFQRLAGG